MVYGSQIILIKIGFDFIVLLERMKVDMFIIRFSSDVQKKMKYKIVIIKTSQLTHANVHIYTYSITNYNTYMLLNFETSKHLVLDNYLLLYL